MNKIATPIRIVIVALAAIIIAYKLGFEEAGHLVHNAIAFLIIISLIVFVHEFGHYIVAKWAGVKIDTFSIGFGKEIWGWNDKSGTRWKISSLPFGGYVKMYGDATEASTPVEEISHFTPEQKSKAFYFKPLYKKAAIVFAGPLFNFILTIVIFTFLPLAGGVSVTTEPVAEKVEKDSPAEAAGIKPGDRILSVDGKEVVLFNDIPRMLFTNLGTPVNLEIKRGDKTLPITLTPKITTRKDDLGNDFKQPIIGISNSETKLNNVTLGSAAVKAVRATYYQCEITLKVVGQIIMGERSARDTLQGPLGMAKVTGQAADKGVKMVFFIMAVISVNLGLINLFPIPVLDGGHLLFYAIEAVIRRPPGKQFQEYSMRIGMALVLMLMAYVIMNDIRNWLLTLTVK